jgi:nucleotide-binding universal stress UspA family protein
MIVIKSILCPVDFFPASLRAVDYAVALANNYQARLTLLHVVSPVLHVADEPPVTAGPLLPALTEGAMRRLRALANKAVRVNVPVECALRTGNIRDEIKGAVVSAQADFIVMGNHGGHPWKRWFTGSVTDCLLREVTVPLLATTSTTESNLAPPAIRRILVSIDFSEGTPEAINYAFSIARECKAEITLLHVIEKPTGTMAKPCSIPLQSIREAHGRLEKLIPVESRKWCDVVTRIESGSPSKVILEMVESEKMELVVMNIRGKSLPAQLLMDGTAERVARDAGCPILLIPPKWAARGMPLKKAA